MAARGPAREGVSARRRGAPSRARLVPAAWPALRSSPDRHSAHHFRTTPGDLLEAVFDLQPYPAVTDSSGEPIASSGFGSRNRKMGIPKKRASGNGEGGP